jgi:hypothetical protein
MPAAIGAWRSAGYSKMDRKGSKEGGRSDRRRVACAESGNLIALYKDLETCRQRGNVRDGATLMAGQIVV